MLVIIATHILCLMWLLVIYGSGCYFALSTQAKEDLARLETTGLFSVPSGDRPRRLELQSLKVWLLSDSPRPGNTTYVAYQDCENLLAGDALCDSSSGLLRNCMSFSCLCR